MKCGVVIVGAGQGIRLGFSLPKAFILLNSKPLFEYSLKIFLDHPQINEVVLVVPQDKLSSFSIKNYKVVAGGESRQDSVSNGISALSLSCEMVLVHDAARPLITKDIVDRLLKALGEGKSCIAAWPISDTLKETKGDAIVQTVDRQNLWEAQTPQAFPIAVLKEALAKARKDNFVGTDEASLVERLGLPVEVVLGDSTNIKITTRQDLELAEALLKRSL